MGKVVSRTIGALISSAFLIVGAPAWSVPSQAPEIVSFSCSDGCNANEGSTNSPIKFNLVYTDGSPNLKYWQIDYGVGDGWIEMIATSSPIEAMYTYTIPGLYNVKVEISNKDDGGKGNYSSDNFSDSETLIIDITGSTQTTSFDITPFAVETSVVPEPGTLALFGLGLAGLGFARRRRKAA